MTTRSGPWREENIGGARPWAVRDGDSFDYTPTGRVKRFSRRAFAYAHAEKLNRRSADATAEVLRELGL